MGCSPPGSSVRGILQARVLEWGAVAFSRRVLWSSDYRNRSQSASTTFPELQRADSRGKGRKTRENSQEKAQRRLGRARVPVRGHAGVPPGGFADKPLPGGRSHRVTSGARPTACRAQPSGTCRLRCCPPRLPRPQPTRRTHMS